MGCLGVHFALDEQEVRKLKSGPFRKVGQLLELLEEYFGNREWFQETDKAWDGIHRALTDGELAWDNGSYPFNHVIMGGERLYFKSDHILVLKTPDQVRDIAAALQGVTREKLKNGYSLITAENCDWEPSEQDWEYTWSWFVPLCDFYQRAAKANRYVVFSATQ